MPAYGDEYYRSGSHREVLLIPDVLCIEVPFTKMNKAGEIAGLGEEISIWA